MRIRIKEQTAFALPGNRIARISPKGGCAVDTLVKATVERAIEDRVLIEVPWESDQEIRVEPFAAEWSFVITVSAAKDDDENPAVLVKIEKVSPDLNDAEARPLVSTVHYDNVPIDEIASILDQVPITQGGAAMKILRRD